MKEKALGALIILLVSLTPVMAFGTEKVSAKHGWGDIDKIEIEEDLVITSAHYRYNLEARESKGRVSLKGKVLINGKDENLNPFRIELKNIKAINNIKQSVAKKSFVKEGKTYFVSEGEDIDISYENKVSKNDKSFDIYAKVTFVGYKNGRDVETGTLRFVYENGKLNLYNKWGDLILSL